MCLPISVSSQVSANYRSACDVLFKVAGKEHSLITPVGLKSMNHIYLFLILFTKSIQGKTPVGY
jgi:hypothetical protein